MNTMPPSSQSSPQLADKILQPWSKTSQDLARELATDLQAGLNDDVVLQRLEQYGPNRLPETHRESLLTHFLRQFADLMIGLLALAAIISGLMGEWVDTILIGLIVIANAIIGFVQEVKAENAVEALKKLSQPQTHVRRQGRIVECPSDQLVPGDLIELKAGDFVPADARVIHAVMTEVDESPLTGESLPVEKSTDSVAAETGIADRVCMVHSGTAVVRGHCTAVVSTTGEDTEIGAIAQLLNKAQAGATPLQQRLAAMNRWIAVAVVVISVLVFIAGIMREPMESWSYHLVSSMMLIAVSLAVAAIPEGLPAVITITLALGSQRMAKRNAIVRRLAAVESLGSVDVICSDKTGTLTQNRMVVADLIAVNPAESNDKAVLTEMILCSDAEAGPNGEIVGSATERALLMKAVEAGIDIRAERHQTPRVDEIPFSSERKRMMTIHQTSDGSRKMIVKGAPDQVLRLCNLSEETINTWEQHILGLAQKGRRTLAVATKALPSGNQDKSESDLALIGIVGIVDPVRPEAREAIQKCRSAGIRPVMITGDHPGTAAAIAEELQLADGKIQVVTGAELESMSPEQLVARVPSVDCYARVSPEHKLRIVDALQKNGHAVAMTGDGVNDAPALKQSDIGVAMGITGTDVAKESAAIVLADDNFSTIVSAVEEGRVVYDNIRKFVSYLLTANTSEVLVLLGAIILGYPIPLLPVHLLWINLVTDGLPALTLGFEPAESNVMHRPARKRQESLFSGGLGWGIIAMGAVMAVVCLGLFAVTVQSSTVGAHIGHGEESDYALDRARSMTFYALAVSQLFYVCGLRSFSQSITQIGLLSNARLTASVVLGIVLQLMTLYVPAFQKLFHTVPLSAGDLALTTALAAIPFLVLELWKLGRRMLDPQVD